jgi:hypothetical protein
MNDEDGAAPVVTSQTREFGGLAKAIVFLAMMVLAVGLLFAPGRDDLWYYFVIGYILAARFAWDQFFASPSPPRSARYEESSREAR